MTDGKSEAQELDMKLAAYLLFPFKKKNKLPITGPQKTTAVNTSVCSLPGYIFRVNTHPYVQLQSNCLAAGQVLALLLQVASGGLRAKMGSPEGQGLACGVNDSEKGSRVRLEGQIALGHGYMGPPVSSVPWQYLWSHWLPPAQS